MRFDLTLWWLRIAAALEFQRGIEVMWRFCCVDCRLMCHRQDGKLYGRFFVGYFNPRRRCHESGYDNHQDVVLVYWPEMEVSRGYQPDAYFLKLEREEQP